MDATPALIQHATPVSLTPLRTMLTWMLSFLAFPIAGYAGTLLVGRIDDPAAAIVGGAVMGAGVGFAQALASRRRLGRIRWTVATILGASIGLAGGTLAIGYRTSLADLAIGGLITGLAVGATQALAMPRDIRLRWLWVPVTTVLWSLGWIVTTLAGIRVDEQVIVFGASGASVYTLLAGLTLLALRLPARTRMDR